ncbi:MAG: MmcB family DNA repair protein [Pseudomonadota bacterium]
MQTAFDMEHPLNPAAEQIAKGTLRLLGDHGFAGVTEMTLANGRRADIAALGTGGEISIIEIKSCLNDFRTDKKWRDYVAYCDRFYFAVGHDFPQNVIPAEVGLIIADGFGGAILREAPLEKVAGARRKAMTLKFARLAATRLLRSG